MDPRRSVDPRLSRDPRRAQDPRLARMNGATGDAYQQHASSVPPPNPVQVTIPTAAPQPVVAQPSALLLNGPRIKQRPLFCVVCASNQVST